MHERLRFSGAGSVNKTPIIGMRERGGRTRALPIQGTGARAIERTVRENIETGSTLHTDEYPAYKRLAPDYKHETVNHKY